MPELAEVEFLRRRWDVGVGQNILDVALHSEKRIFRGNDLAALRRVLPGARLIGSEARGKQMLFRFNRDAWLGVHLGMTGELRHEPRDFPPGRHDHLVLRQARQALVFSDPRAFAAQGRAPAAGVFHRHRQLDGGRNSLAREDSPASRGGQAVGC